MQLTISSDDDFDRVLEAVGALFGVRLTVDETAAPTTRDQVAPLEESGEGQRVTKTRH